MSALGLAAVLSGCGVGGDSSDVTLTLVAADYGNGAADSSKKYWAGLVERYETDHPDVDIDVSVYSWNDVDRKVKEMVDAGSPPDMAQIGAYADYASQGLLYRAGDLLSIPVQADFLSQLSGAGELNSVQYGMPFAASTRLLFYNKSLFAEAGLTPPETWDELVECAEALKANGVKFPYALPLGPEEAQAETLQWLLSGDGGYTDIGGTYGIDSTENVETFSWLRDELVGKGLTGPVAPGKLDRAKAFQAFAAGDVGMLNGHPSLMEMAKKKGVKYGMVPIPGADGETPSTLGVADWMMAFEKNGHRDEIGDFLDFVYSEENVLDFSREYDLLPVTNSASRAMAASGQDKELKPFLDQLPLSQLYPVGKTSWAAVNAAIKQKIGRAVEPGGSPEDVLGELQAAAVRADSAG
ncbi:extracellular solute-binding protein [Streptomyces cellulosae]|uniref:Extracellular solute-binding protein n=2 Tax=Streptomyces TaxID=1883 RepID=A0ABU3J7U0_9ACTN|nr:multiple sugar transport system substrate-binding protein [Streptomyces thermodiastaticus]MDT6971129.1 extracellular solute-binding protein [Streptomyces thermocarboxydus]MXQ59111.1 extracellular solute-binding protein [Streptomyces sp. XHT-2]MYQ36023.1 extracellular solute-binding protein [Streptomyces sp. SID4956]THC56500.1 extracellular solute-binding protein [Streptomyces sp. Akac8]WSB42093.1 extracellular solute-binding protein [Streptomyces cellulosae]